MKNATKKARIKDWGQQFETEFDISGDAIDLRTMADNYEDGLIPVTDIAQGISSVIGESFTDDFDPRKKKTYAPEFKWVPIDKVYLDPRFQRDVSPNHVRKIESDFDSRMVLVPCAVYRADKDVYCLWDGHHTIQNKIRAGWTHVPVWYTSIDYLSQAEIDQAKDALSGLAGRSFLSINKKNKRPVDNYDAFMILLETEDADTVAVNNILTSNQCQPRRAKKNPGDVTHFTALWECYLMENKNGLNGVYLNRALQFHRTHWPRAGVEAEVMRPMCRIYQMFETQMGRMPSQEFDKVLGEKLIEMYGSAESVQLELKQKYEDEFGETGRDDNPTQVTSGILNVYRQHINEEKHPPAPIPYPV